MSVLTYNMPDSSHRLESGRLVASAGDPAEGHSVGRGGLVLVGVYRICVTQWTGWFGKVVVVMIVLGVAAAKDLLHE